MRTASVRPPVLHLSLVLGGALRDGAGERLGKVEDLIVRLGEQDAVDDLDGDEQRDDGDAGINLFLWRLARNREIMGDRRNKGPLDGLAAITVFLTSSLSIILVVVSLLGL